MAGQPRFERARYDSNDAVSWDLRGRCWLSVYGDTDSSNLEAVGFASSHVGVRSTRKEKKRPAFSYVAGLLNRGTSRVKP
jgi:hypothetical protein